jgi:antitoxin component of MazEF toxin-antitoxin module
MEKNLIKLENLAFERSVVKLGNSLFICLPETYVSLTRIKKGEKLVLNIQPDGTLKVSPEAMQ